MTTPDDSGFAAVMLKLTEFAARLAVLEAKPETYPIEPSIHWWSVTAQQRAQAVEHLAVWVEQVYRPHYGYLAAMLGDCWQQHDLCLVQLDWLSELHSFLYFSEPAQAILAAQAEYGTRIVPAVSEQFGKETSNCAHQKERANGSSWRNGSAGQR